MAFFLYNFFNDSFFRSATEWKLSTVIPGVFFCDKFFSTLILIQIKQSLEYGDREGSGSNIQLWLVEKLNLLHL